METRATGTDRGASGRFAGQKGYVNDDLSGMQLLGARYYIPALGRFLTQDPIGHEGGLNLYAYCGDSPLMSSDPSGHGPESILMAVSRALYPARYGSADDAGIASIQSAVPLSDTIKAEHAGLIYQYPDMSWSYTPPLTLPVPAFTHSQPFMGLPFVPPGATVIGSYHTHPWKPGFNGAVTASDGPGMDRDWADNRLYARGPYASYFLKYNYVGDGMPGRPGEERHFISVWTAGRPGFSRFLHGYDSFGIGKRPKALP